MNDILIYSLSNTKSLHDVFSVVLEIGTELGMYPEEIKLKDGRSITYNRADAGMLEKGTISEEAYIGKNQCDSTIIP